MGVFDNIEAVDGFEPTIKLLQSRALPLGYTALTFIIIPFKLNLVNSFFSENVSFPAFKRHATKYSENSFTFERDYGIINSISLILYRGVN